MINFSQRRYQDILIINLHFGKIKEQAGVGVVPSLGLARS